jgi:hypothetical protein
MGNIGEKSDEKRNYVEMALSRPSIRRNASFEPKLEQEAAGRFPFRIGKWTDCAM